MKNIYLIVSLLFLVLISYISFLNFSSLRLQTNLLKEFNENKYTDATLQKVLNSKVTIPNISVTTMPLNVMYARYFHIAGQHDIALKMLDKPINDNPYLYTKETLKSSIYTYLSVNDSAEYYAKKAFYNLPGNAVNFELLMKALSKKRDFAEIKSSFDSITKKQNPQFWKIYLSTLLNIDSINTPEIIDQAKEAKLLFPKNKDINVLSDFILYGVENINEALKLDKLAAKAFKSNDFVLAANLYENAAKLNPSDYSFSENAGFAYLKQSKYSIAIPFLQKVVDSLNPKTGKAEYLLALSYVGLNKKQKACDYFRKSTKFNFKPAFAELSKNCK